MDLEGHVKLILGDLALALAKARSDADTAQAELAKRPIPETPETPKPDALP